MQLITSRFGHVDFEPAELLVFEHGLIDFPRDRQWLLLADAAHASLYWLQSISRSSIAVPVVELPPELSRTIRQPLDVEVRRELKLRADSVLLLLAPVRLEEAGLSVDADLPIVVNTNSGKCRQLRNERHHSDQRTMASMSATLRECA